MAFPSISFPAIPSISTVTGILNGQAQKVQFIQNSTGTILTLDCSVQETHTRESPPTEFEVESGVSISDHIIVKPKSLEIQGLITDTPLSVLNSAVTTVASALLPNIALVGAAAGISLFKSLVGSKSPSVQAFGQLLSLQESRVPFDVLTSLYRYTNMYIKSISVPRDATTGQVLLFTVSLVQLIIVQPKYTNLSQFSNADLAANELNNGQQEGTSFAAQQFKAGQAALHTVTGL